MIGGVLYSPDMCKCQKLWLHGRVHSQRPRKNAELLDPDLTASPSYAAMICTRFNLPRVPTSGVICLGNEQQRRVGFLRTCGRL